MMDKDDKSIGVFPAVLKFWRNSRGLSQLDLGLAADVSPRHISFLETGRAKPSREMVLTLAATLDVPLREQNTMLSAAGFQPEFEETPLGPNTRGPIERVINRMLEKHEPYPMIVMDSGYDLIKSNRSAQRLIALFIADPSAAKPPLNLYEMLFHPALARPFVQDWETLAHQMLARINRESLLRPYNARLVGLLEKLLGFPGVPEHWRVPDYALTSEPFLLLRMRRADHTLSFLTILTTFSAPQNITAQEVLIETLFPADEETEASCQQLSA